MFITKHAYSRNSLSSNSLIYLIIFQSDVKKHYDEVHLKLREFRCEICGLTFARKDTLNKHQGVSFVFLFLIFCEVYVVDPLHRLNQFLHIPCSFLNCAFDFISVRLDLRSSLSRFCFMRIHRKPWMWWN